MKKLLTVTLIALLGATLTAEVVAGRQAKGRKRGQAIPGKTTGKAHHQKYVTGGHKRHDKKRQRTLSRKLAVRARTSGKSQLDDTKGMLMGAKPGETSKQVAGRSKKLLIEDAARDNERAAYRKQVGSQKRLVRGKDATNPYRFRKALESIATKLGSTWERVGVSYLRDPKEVRTFVRVYVADWVAQGKPARGAFENMHVMRGLQSSTSPEAQTWRNELKAAESKVLGAPLPAGL